MSVTLFYNNVTVLDYAYLDKMHGLMGDALKVNIEFIGKVDQDGVIFDFSLAKKKVKEIIDFECDHRLVIPQNLAARDGGQISFQYNYGSKEKLLTYNAPEEAVCEIPYDHVSSHNLIAHLETLIMKEMPETVESVRLELEAEELDKDAIRFHYTHGLKDHFGNCQRLFHGHGNTLEIWVNGAREVELEHWMSKELFSSSIHFLYWENVQNKGEVLSAFGSNPVTGRIPNGMGSVHIKYQSSQGEFEAKLPAESVFITQTETTVENLSMEFAQIVKNEVGPNRRVMVRAFEGIGKGAITHL